MRSVTVVVHCLLVVAALASPMFGCAGTTVEPQTAASNRQEPAAPAATQAPTARVPGRVALLDWSLNDQGHFSDGDTLGISLKDAYLSHLGEIEQCYDALLARHPGLEARVEVDLTLQPDGSVVNAHATRNTSNDAATAACVVAPALGLHVPQGAFATSLNFGFLFALAPADRVDWEGEPADTQAGANVADPFR